MPSQLINNGHIEFMCAKNFTYNGEDFTLGEMFDQDKAVQHIDTLVRARYLYAVVEDSANKPRHWHHHVWIKSDLQKKLGVLKNSRSTTLVGESLYNKPKQMELKQPVQDYKTMTPWDETDNPSQKLHDLQQEAIYKELVLQQENDEVEEPDEDEETEPDALVIPGEQSEEFTEEQEDERVIDEDDLYDPSQHNTTDVLEYLTGDITDEERERVLAAERNGKARKGILNV